MKKLILTSVVVLALLSCKPEPDMKYLGQTPPGNTAELFAPGVISLDDREESMITFSPDGLRCYFTEHHQSWQWCKIKQSVWVDTVWTAPVDAAFTDNYSMCPSISHDGTQLFFASGRDSLMNVFECDLTNGEWSAPEGMVSAISSNSYEYSCHPSSLGSMFVCSWRAGAVGGCDGWRVPFKDGNYQKAENLGLLNSVVGDCVWAPGPNEEYLVFQSRRPATGSPGGFFETDLYITFAMPDGTWSQPQNMGPQINSKATDGFAWITQDGKYMFFTSNRRGTSDIYWVSMDSIVANTPREPLVAINHGPGEPACYQKYKDPSDTVTTIYFDLEKGGETEIIILDRAGKKKKTVMKELREKGENTFV